MMGETGPMGLHSKGRKTDMKTAAKRERKTLRIVELALLLGAAAFLMTGVWALNTQRDLADKVVRLHVLANSDTEEDQALKLLVRDAVLERATEILEQSADRAEAEIRLRESLPELEAIAEETVRANGYDYAVTAELEDTAFPTKEYDGFSLPAGEYLALRILIGEGVGQNWWCVVFPPLCTAASAGVPETALAAGLTEDQVSLMTEEDGGYQLKFKAVELWERLKAALDEVFAEPCPNVIDCVESKVFGIGLESMTVGSNEFYTAYAATHPGVYNLLDAGHYHPTEFISDKIPAMLCFFDKVPLHVTRPVRWDSDHVVLFDDETREIMKEVVRNDALDRVLIGLDFFDASINRVAAWVVGTRSAQKALLFALLQPDEKLRQLQDGANFTEKMVLMEEAKTLPFGDVWAEYCRRQGVPADGDWYAAVTQYEKEVLSRRG